MAKVGLDAGASIPIVGASTEVAPQTKAKADPSTPDLVPAKFRSLPGGKRAAGAQTSATHVNMMALLNGAIDFKNNALRVLQDGLQEVDRTMAQLLSTTSPLALAGGFTVDAPRPVLGDNVLKMSTIGEMISGSLRRKCPGEMLNREYEDVVALAKQGNKAARTAKKLAEQGDRLRAKNKGKKR